MANFNLYNHISKTADFPKEGLTFYDISPALEDPDVLAQMIKDMTKLAANFQPDVFAGIDARGFLFSMPLAFALKCGTTIVRKAGKLPGKMLGEAYALEYGTARLSMHASRAVKDKRVVLSNDLLVTGGTLAATEKLVEFSGGYIAGAACVIELIGLNGRDRLGCDVAALQMYEF